MKIGIDCRMHSTKFTGIGRYVQQLVHHLSEIDSENTYLLYFNDPEYSNFTCPGPNFNKILVNAKHYSIQEQIKFPWIIHKTKPDLVHFTHFNTPFFTLRPHITTIHDLILHLYPGNKFNKLHHKLAYRSILYKTLRFSKHIISVSKNTENDLHRLYKFTKRKSSTIYLGVADDFLNYNPDTPIQLNFELPKNYLLYTGNWRVHKNIPTVIKAFAILKKEYNYKGKLILTGRENPLYPETRAEIMKHSLENEVISPGLVPAEHLPHLYANADCYVSASLYEGFGLQILESFAVKTPVVISNQSCLPEIGGKGILTFNPYDSQEAALRINQVLNDKKIRGKLIKNGTERLKDFSFRHMAEETLNLYKQFDKNQKQ